MTASQHRARLADAAAPIPVSERPEAGPISVLPEAGSEPFAQAIRDAGGQVAPLGEDTRGLVFLDYSAPQTLADALDRHPGITWVQLPYAGIDAMASLVAPHADRGVVFTSAKGAYAEPVAEHALTLALAVARRLPLRARATSWAKRQEGLSLYGANVVIVGAGGIALEFIDLLAPFRVRVTVVRRRAEAVTGADRTITTDELDGALAEADLVVLAAAANDGTKHLLDARRLALLPERAIVVNIARGPLIDTEALADALEAGQLYGAGLDVTDPEPLPDGHRLWTNERALITPHTADTPEMVEPLLQERIRQNVEGFLRTGVFVGRCDPRLGY